MIRRMHTRFARFARERPTAALLVAVVALIFAVAGTSVASVATISSLTKSEKKTVKKIANKQIKKKGPGLSVANAKKLGGQPASSYAPASTLRTALVAANGSVDAAHSDGVTQANVTQPVGGVYCFNGLSPAPRSVVASIAGGTAGIQTQTQYAPTGGVCAGSQFDVATLSDANALVPDAFTVFIH
jgi:hypothetical protein